MPQPSFGGQNQVSVGDPGIKARPERAWIMDDYTVYSNRYSEISVMGEILLIDNPEIQALKKHINQVQKEMELSQELNY